MLNVKIGEDLSEPIAREARRRKVSQSAIVREAVAAWLEDLEDLRDAKAAMKKGGKPIPIDEVRRRLGL